MNKLISVLVLCSVVACAPEKKQPVGECVFSGEYVNETTPVNPDQCPDLGDFPTAFNQEPGKKPCATFFVLADGTEGRTVCQPGNPVETCEGTVDMQPEDCQYTVNSYRAE